MIPLISAIAVVKPNTRRSILASSSCACSAGKNDGRTSEVHNATSSPSAPPAMPRIRLSVSICRTSLCRLAPIASLTAISRWRAVALESSSPATFAQAISRTSATAASSTPAIIETWPLNAGSILEWRTASIGRGRSGAASVPRFVPGNSAASVAAIPSSCACAWVRSEPGESRPTMDSERLPRSGAPTGISGVHRSYAAPRLRPVNSAGTTPITVYGVPFAVTTAPTAAGSATERPLPQCVTNDGNGRFTRDRV